MDKKKVLLGGAVLALVGGAAAAAAYYKSQQKKEEEEHVACECSSTEEAHQEVETSWFKGPRLPKNVIPSHYDLTLRVDLANCRFSGEELIDIEITEETNLIVVNSIELRVLAVEIFTDHTQQSSQTIQYLEEKEVVGFFFAKKIPKGKAQLKVLFQGTLNDQMKGFYRGKYKHYSGEERNMACTQFEAADARRCFPCWDEPALKATFSVSLVVPANRIALSNMPIIEEISAYDMKKVKFDVTPKMSTYLLAFVVGELDYVKGYTEDGVEIRVYTPLNKANQGDFALNVALQALPFYEKFFGIKYPLPKCDMVALPDFAAGAMENWGLITYRETCLLVDPQSTSTATKQYVALVVGHELAHQWFGNLVTMEWWTHLWLNEGFASYMEYIAVDHCFPEWNMWSQFVFQDFGQALALDSLESSHPVEVEVATPAEIDEIFDAISYSKGCSIIRMLAEFLGQDVFSRGLNGYLNRHIWKNTITEDLWVSLSEASNQPVKEIMDKWTKQTGYPILTVEEQESTSSERVFKLTQSRFLASGASDKSNSLWYIPLTWKTSKGQHSQLMKTKSDTIRISGLTKDDWIKFNSSQTGLYRIKYPSHMLIHLQPAIQDQTLPASDRLGIQNDSISLAKAGLASTVDALKLISSYSKETDYTVWADLATNLDNLEVIVSSTDFLSSFHTFCKKLYSPVAALIGWDPKPNETHQDSLLRSLVLARAAKFGNNDIVEEAKKKFAKYLDDRSSLAADLRPVVYKTALANGDEETYNQLLQLFRETDLQEEKDRIMRCLGACKSPELLQRTLLFAISEEVRLQDTVFVIGSVASNPKGRELAWKFIRDNWEMLAKRHHGFLLSRLVKCCADFASEEKASEVEQFFASVKTPGIERAAQQSVESIRSNAAWLKRDGEAIRAFLASQ